MFRMAALSAVVVMVGCGVTESQVVGDDAPQGEGSAELGTASRTYVTVRHDMRKCILFLCGGYWVAEVNRANWSKFVDGAQIISPAGDRVLASASTLDKELRSGSTGNVEAATAVGKLVAERAKAAGVSQVAFDRAGFRYHGRVKALADGAREGGLEF